MRGEKRYYGKADTLVQIAVYVFLINALCKYFYRILLRKSCRYLQCYWLG